MENTLRLSKRSAWTSEEDNRLRACIERYGEGQWHQVPQRAGLNRCRKSCRFRWLNYLKPTIKRGDFELDEVDLIMRMHKLLGNRWALIAGRLPRRTANDVKNYWRYRIKKQLISSKENTTRKITRHNIFKPRPHTISSNYFFCSDGIRLVNTTKTIPTNTLPEPYITNEIRSSWWEESMNVENGDEEKMKKRCNNGDFEENVAQQIETTAGNDAISISLYEQDKSLSSDMCFDDVDFSELHDILHDDQLFT